MSIGLKADLLGPSLLYSGGGPFDCLKVTTEGKTMGKYGNGIGMTDVAAMMKAVEAMHTCRVEFRVQTAGKGVDGSMNIDCVASFDVLPGSDLPKVVQVGHAWPSNAARTFDGLCYNLLWQLDYAIQKAYEQMPLEQK
jgi:hypothetical protein